MIHSIFNVLIIVQWYKTIILPHSQICYNNEKQNKMSHWRGTVLYYRCTGVNYCIINICSTPQQSSHCLLMLLKQEQEIVFYQRIAHQSTVVKQSLILLFEAFNLSNVMTHQSQQCSSMQRTCPFFSVACLSTDKCYSQQTNGSFFSMCRMRESRKSEVMDSSPARWNEGNQTTNPVNEAPFPSHCLQLLSHLWHI